MAKGSKAGSASCSLVAPRTSRRKPSPRTSTEKACRMVRPAARAASAPAISWSVKPFASSRAWPRPGHAASSPCPFRWASASAGLMPKRTSPSSAAADRVEMTTPSSVSRLVSGPFQGAEPRARPPRRSDRSASSNSAVTCPLRRPGPVNSLPRPPNSRWARRDGASSPSSVQTRTRATISVSRSARSSAKAG